MRKIRFILSLTAGLLTSLPAYAGSLSGKVLFEGAAPERVEIHMNADPTCASLHTGPVFRDDAVVNDNGTLRHVFVYVKEGLEGQSFPLPAGTVTLDQNGCIYSPHVFGVRTGQQVVIVNSDSTLHNVHGMPKASREFNLGMPIQGMKLKRKFDAPEVMVKFKCDVHPWMAAWAGVLDHPFFHVTGEDGSFEISGLPEGTYTLEAWHEKYGTKTQQVTVGADSAAAVEFTFTG